VVPPPPPPPDEPPPEDGGPIANYQYTTDEAIALFRARIKRNPEDFHSYRYLGELLERQARESGDHAAFAPAEEALRKALALNPSYPRARASLAAVLCARHKFAEALEIARPLARERPNDIDALATLGDALLELGRYEEAEGVYEKLAALAPIPEVFARRANLLDLTGRQDAAESLLRRAVEAAEKQGGAKAAAWYRWRLGELAFERGKLDEAAALYASVPDGVDAQHDATAGLARVRAAQGRIDEAIELYQKAIAIGPDAPMLAALGDLLVRTGQPEKAEPLYEQVIRDTKDKPEHRRTLAVFLLDHDRDLPLALELARADYAERQDIPGRDVLAWALFKNGKAEEAAPILDEALKLGNRDARLHYHAGMIHHRLGDASKARALLKRVLELNPYFSASGAEEAKRTLEALGDSK
jgi:tetratricopeptide (TPR) repeat protein